jgi:cytochrome P450
MAGDNRDEMPYDTSPWHPTPPHRPTPGTRRAAPQRPGVAEIAPASAAEASEPLYNPLAPSFRIDPYPALHRLRARDPVHWSASGYCWVLTRYNDIKLVLSDKRFAIALHRLMAIPALQGVFSEPYNQLIRTQLLSSDPPDHPRIRAVYTRSLSPPRMEKLRLRVQEIVDELIHKGLAAGGMDLIADFAHALPFRVICEILNVPPDEREPLAHHTHAMMRTTDPTPMSAHETAEANAAALGFADYFLRALHRYTAEPQADFFGELVAAVHDKVINQEEFVANLILLFCAGHDTVINLLGNGMLALHRYPRQWQILVEDPTPATLRGAVEELLRFDTSVQIARRTALENVQLGDRLIYEGQYVLCSLGAGNRDPEVFPDPDRLDVTRKNVKPLSFGGGIHYCLGAQLARLEGELGFGTLARRAPNLSLHTLEPEWKQNTFVRGVKALPIEF